MEALKQAYDARARELQALTKKQLHELLAAEPDLEEHRPDLPPLGAKKPPPPSPPPPPVVKRDANGEDPKFYEVISQRDYVAMETAKGTPEQRQLYRLLDDIAFQANEYWENQIEKETNLGHASEWNPEKVKAGMYNKLTEADTGSLPLHCLMSHKAHRDCPSSEVMPVLITGVGRSGTHYMQHQFNSHGFSFMHEAVAADGASSWSK